MTQQQTMAVVAIQMSNADGVDVERTNSRMNFPNVTTTGQAVPPASSGSFYEKITRLVMGQSQSKSASASTNGLASADQQNDKKTSNNSTTTIVQPPALPKRACRAPASRKFAHPCSCSQSNSNHKSHAATYNSSGSLPPAAYTHIHLYDPATKKCLPTSRSRDMLLKECRSNVAAPYQTSKLYHGAPCVYDDLVCDARRNRCICKPNLHLYYESGTNNTAFGCIPLPLTIGPAGRAPCKSGYIYNVISSECQKIFDVNELPPNPTAGVSATQFSFVTIVLMWLLLFIFIATTKLRKCRNQNLYGGSPSSERRLHRGGSYRAQSQGGTTTWLHPFIAAVNGHHYSAQHRTIIDRQSQAADDMGIFSDTDFFLSNGGRRLNELFPDGTFAGSQHSLNNPPPKFEEIYPSCPEGQQISIQLPLPPSNEDLPTYDEAMKLQDTSPTDANQIKS